MTRFTELNVEEVRMKFKLHDIRKSKAWQQMREEGRQEGLEEGEAQCLKKTVETLLAKRKTLEEIADLLDIPLARLGQVLENRPNGKSSL
jgi:predicted transposase YdaD